MVFVFFILGLAPILWLIFALTVLKWPAFKAAFGSLGIAAVIALFKGLGILDVATATLEGFIMALWPIVIVIIAAVFTYNLCVKTGAMDVIKQLLTSVSSDKRVLVLLIAWCFGGFMEGMAGFGTAVAIPAGMLVALGFKPLFSVLVCLIANGVPTPFGSIGIPTVTLSNLVGLEAAKLSAISTIQLLPFIVLAPIFIVFVTGKGVKGMKGMWPITLASGLAFGLPQLAVAYFVGPELCVVVGAVCSMAVTIFLAQKMTPDPKFQVKGSQEKEKGSLDINKALIAACPFICIFVFLLLTSKLIGPVNTFLGQFSSKITVYTGANPGSLTLSWINTPGVWIFLSAIIGGIVQKASPKDFLEVFKGTLKQMSKTVYMMLAILGCAKVMIYSGMISDIAAFVIAITGSFYPFFAPLLGALGTFVTGSGTSSEVLFGAVQQNAAESLGTNPYWMVALNSLGIAAGKMISLQNIAIGLSAVPNGEGNDSKMLTKVMPYTIIFLVLMCILAYVGFIIVH
ncbi:MAG: L-lactate permease [Bacillota bacterium]|nr:L-lactate permease [Bacillota bacterium]